MQRLYSLVLLSLWTFALCHCQIESSHFHMSNGESSATHQHENKGHHHHHNRSGENGGQQEDHSDRCELRDISTNHNEKIHSLITLLTKENLIHKLLPTSSYYYATPLIIRLFILEPTRDEDYLLSQSAISQNKNSLIYLSNAPPANLTFI